MKAQHIIILFNHNFNSTTAKINGAEVEHEEKIAILYRNKEKMVKY